MVMKCYEIAHATNRPIDEVMNYNMIQLEGWLEYFSKRAEKNGGEIKN